MKLLILLFSCLVFVSCSSKVLQVENSDKLLQIDDYDKTLKIKETTQPKEPTVAPVLASIVEPQKKVDDFFPTPKKKEEVVKEPPKVTKAKVVKTKVKKKLPALEDSEGFDGRRPIVDPFRAGEKVVLKLSYFNVAAGEMTVSVLPFKEVNGRKSYHFQVAGKSYGFFSSVYTVDDKAETFLDYETLLPYNMALDVKESKKLSTIRSYFDWKKMKGFYWEKKITTKHGVEEKNLEWDIEPYSQNLFSAIFYLRTFTLTPGKIVQFRVADNKKNMVVKGHVLRRETLKTEVGEFKTVVVRPEVEIDGIFKPMGEVLFWLTDDDRKFVVRIESKIKIGTIIGSLKEIIP